MTLWIPGRTSGVKIEDISAGRAVGTGTLPGGGFHRVQNTRSRAFRRRASGLRVNRDRPRNQSRLGRPHPRVFDEVLPAKPGGQLAGQRPDLDGVRLAATGLPDRFPIPGKFG